MTPLFNLQDEVEKLGIPEGYEPHYGVTFGYKNIEKELTATKRNVDVINHIK